MRLGRPAPPIVLTTDERDMLERWTRRPTPCPSSLLADTIGSVAPFRIMRAASTHIVNHIMCVMWSSQ